MYVHGVILPTPDIGADQAAADIEVEDQDRGQGRQPAFGGGKLRLESLDPGGAIARAIPTERVIGCVVHLAASVQGPGVIRHNMGTRLILGEPGGKNGERTEQLAHELRNATFEVWLTWAGGAAYQRIFDFGDDTSMVEDNRTSFPGRTYLFLTPKTYNDQGANMRVAYASAQVHEVQLDSVHPFPLNAKTHVALVVDSDAEQMALYMNGEFEKSMDFSGDRLMLIHDVNNWLGRSNYFYDPCITGTFHEFRIYSAALSASQLHESFVLGPDAVLPR